MAGPDNVIVGKAVPALSAGKDGYGWKYDHATGAMVWVRHASKAELDAHTGDTANPHAVTKAQVGLGSVDDVAQLPKTIVACVVRKSAAQSIAATTHSVLTWDTESEDPGNWHSNVTNNSRITVTSTGWYRVSAMVSWAANTSGGRLIRIVKNGVKLVASANFGAKTESHSTPYFEGRLAAGDYVEVHVYQDSGGARDVLGDNGISTFADTEFRVVWAGI